jgi:hypothetical protein
MRAGCHENVVEGDMKLKDYMERNEGEYLVAESTKTVTSEDLDGTLCELEVEAHLVGVDPGGRRRFHLYATEMPLHVVTHVEET